MTLAYLDSSAVLDWLQSKASSPGPKAQDCGLEVERILHDSAVECAASELVLIEVLNGLHTRWRDTNPTESSYNEAWVRSSQSLMLHTVSSGGLSILRAHAVDLEHALMLVTLMSKEGRSFRAWDALHLRMAVQWSRASGEKVDLVTSDGDFAGFLEAYTTFERHVVLRDLRSLSS